MFPNKNVTDPTINENDGPQPQIPCSSISNQIKS